MKYNKTFKLAMTALAVTLTSTLLASCMTQPYATTNYNQPVVSQYQGSNSQAYTTQAAQQQYNYTGSISGTETRVYQFTAQRGQLLRVVRTNTSQKIDVNLRYVGNDAAARNAVLRGDYQILPATGTYEIIVGQSRQDARKQPLANVGYNLQVVIENVAGATYSQPQSYASNSSSVNYVCDNGTNFTVVYTGSTASLNIRGVPQTLYLNSQYGGADNPVFTNKDYMLSVGTPTVGNYRQSEIYSILSFAKSRNGQAIYQNCQVR